jgi:4a-hydroxytetrahydrobiopterin dehydratase
MREASDAVESIGWRYLLGSLRTAVTVTSLSQASTVVAKAVDACAADADGHLWCDVRANKVILVLQSLDAARVTDLDTALAGRVSLAVREVGLETSADVESDASRAVQLVEIAVDALDIPAVRPFWKAVFAYEDEASNDGPTDALVDPQRQGPAIWFQQMDAPRPQRNRIHFDICVPHDEAQRRIAAGLAAGGRLLDEEAAPAFWVLADPEGNEVCITTWQGREAE